jgi:hypothetical protein
MRSEKRVTSETSRGWTEFAAEELPILDALAALCFSAVSSAHNTLKRTITAFFNFIY